MRSGFGKAQAVAASIVFLSSCGLHVPDKGLLPDSNKDARAIYEERLIRHINCELKIGLARAYTTKKVPWLKDWGTAVTLLVTTQDQSGVGGGLTFISPLRNVVSLFDTGGAVTRAQSRSLSIGGAFSASATRGETIQFTYLNSHLIKAASPGEKCADLQDGLAIDGDLKIADFIYDKAFIADLGNATGDAPQQWPIYNTLTEEIIFLASLGGNLTPSLFQATLTANTGGSFLSSQRTYLNNLIITIGPVSRGPSPTSPAQLDGAALFQHNSKVQASAIATAVQGQSR